MVPPHVRSAIQAALTPGAFSSPECLPLHFTVEACATWRWELLSGRLLDAALTREERDFAAWHVLQTPEAGSAQRVPRLSLLYDTAAEQLHVVRHLRVYGWEAYESAPQVIESRPVEKWLRELVGTLATGTSSTGTDEQELSQACSRLIFAAICGASRLPVASHESQLPAFALGQLGYWPCLAAKATIDAVRSDFATSGFEQSDRALHDPCALATLAFTQPAPLWERAKLLEAALRATPEAEVAALCHHCRTLLQQRPHLQAALVPLLKTLFHGQGLTPYIPLEARIAALLDCLAAEEGMRAPLLDLVAFLLRQLAWHLTAFDLRLFHNYGADYPDLLLLDALLKLYGNWAQQQPERFRGEGAAVKKRRSAWLLGSLLRVQYEGLPVPEAPTSPGENQRVLPAPLVHVDDAEIMEPRLRRKRLFENEPWEAWLAEQDAARGGERPLAQTLAAALADLASPLADSLKALGTALFLDRPLGVHRPPEAIDDTPLLSYLARSRSVAQARVRLMQSWGWLPGEAAETLSAAIRSWDDWGLPAEQVPGEPRPGVASLADARLVAPDFAFLRTTRGSLDLLLAAGVLPLESLEPETRIWLEQSRQVLLIRTSAEPAAARGGPGSRRSLVAYDALGNVRATLPLPE